ncbi:hypothetical protein [Paenibacillus sp. Marseille-Q4541]|uniref:hypothetical protein n=1 Tax=Paenibacillus sp. Marseille-Q4541 TaxID=2831522 RepID=UPI001BA9B03A|nr:hypothetical protein [Paenibacillus sp. Marseille-Q4541]
MRKKKTWIILFSCLVVLFVGGKWVYNTVIHTAANQISAELAKPEVEQALNQLKEQYASSDSNTKPAESSNKEDKNDAVFKSQDDALKFVISRVSVSDIKDVKEITSEGLTEENKEKLQKMALENFTTEEIEALLQALQ